MYLYRYLSVLLLLISLEAKTLEINETTKKYDLLIHSSIYIDYNKTLKIDNILEEDLFFRLLAKLLYTTES